MLKAIILGIQDYMKDCFHDNVLNDAELMGCKVYTKATTFDSKTQKSKQKWVPDSSWKEGNIWHYIQQRLITRKYLKEHK